MKQGHQRRILLGKNTTTTSDPADWILGYKRNGIWKVICRGSIFTFNPKDPRPFNVERMTQAQVDERLESFKIFSVPHLRSFKAVLFVEFERRIGTKAECHAIDSVDQAQEVDKREMEWKSERRTERMRTLFQH